MHTAAVRKPWRSVWFWVALVAAVALVAFLLFSPTFKEWIEGVAAWAEGIMRAHPVAGGVVFFVLSAISALLAFASSVLLVPPANEVWGKPVTFLLLWGGWTAGAIGAFFIGYFARSLLLRLVSEADLEKYEKLASKRMKLWAAMLLCLAVPSELPGYLFGGLHYPFWKFLAAISIAEGDLRDRRRRRRREPHRGEAGDARHRRSGFWSSSPWGRAAAACAKSASCARARTRIARRAYFSVARYAAMSRASRSVTPRFGIAPSG